MKLTHATMVLFGTWSVGVLITALHHSGIARLPDEMFRLALYIAIWPSFFVFIIALLRHGNCRPTLVESDVYMCRLKSGARNLFVWGGGASALLLIAAAFSGSPHESIFYSVISMLFLYALALGLVSKLEWNERYLRATDRFLASKTHQWKDILAVNDSLYASETILKFERSGKARISYFYEGHDAVVAKAQEVLKHARTSRS